MIIMVVVPRKHRVTAKLVYGRQEKTKFSSEELYKKEILENETRDVLFSVCFVSCIVDYCLFLVFHTPNTVFHTLTSRICCKDTI